MSSVSPSLPPMRAIPKKAWRRGKIRIVKIDEKFFPREFDRVRCAYLGAELEYLFVFSKGEEPRFPNGAYMVPIENVLAHISGNHAAYSCLLAQYGEVLSILDREKFATICLAFFPEHCEEVVE